MQLRAATLTLCMLLGLLPVSACGTKPALPPAPVEIPLRADLAAQCEALATPQASELLPLAGEHADDPLRIVQLAERAWWMEFVLAYDGVSARMCARYLELHGLITTYNAAARSAAEGWPR